MILKIRIDGFKSLNNFELSLTKGLNILVGPNGAGKTNIVSFFEFLSYLVSRDLYEAISLMGGAGSIFKKVGENQFTNFIFSEIHGSSKIENKLYLNYIYSFKIEASIKKGLIYFKNQILQFTIDDKQINYSHEDISIVKWDFNILQNYESGGVNEIILHEMKKRVTEGSYSDYKNKKSFQSYLNGFAKNESNRSILSILSRNISYAYNIVSDLFGGETYNIVPSRIKQPEDISKQPGINKDGTGLAATLFALKQGQIYPRRNFMFPYRFYPLKKINPNIFNRIKELTKLANSSIEDLEVENNPFDNQLLIKIILNNNNKTTVLPLSSMSDGTIKWITLITAILTSNYIFSIEEPENFLHPWMQAEIIKIMRNSFDNGNQSFILLSTHSETIINNVKPEELIIVFMQNGITKTKRVNNSELLKKEISKTGFGLGYYYLTGVLGND